MSEEKNGRQCAPYLLITKRKLFFFSFFSLGLFRCYWTYKNWSAIRLAEKDERIYPFFRSWLFGFLWIFPLLEYIGKDCGGKKHFSFFYTVSSVGYWLLDIFFLSLVVFTARRVFSLDILPLFLMFLEMVVLNGVLSFLLFPAQQRINEATGFEGKKLVSEKTGVSAGEVVFSVGFIAGFILPALFFFNALYFGYYKKPVEEVKSTVPTVAESMQESREIIFALLYRYQRGYKDFCKEAGFELKKYPPVFQEEFKEELEYLNRRFEAQGSSMEKVLDDMQNVLGPVIQSAIQQEMSSLRKDLLEQSERRKEGLFLFFDVDTDELLIKEGQMPMMYVCRAWDELAAQFLSQENTVKKSFQKHVLAF